MLSGREILTNERTRKLQSVSTSPSKLSCFPWYLRRRGTEYVLEYERLQGVSHARVIQVGQSIMERFFR